ncbi:MAG: SpoIIE family protein phosphatase [Calditrichia bacterium]
MVERTRKFNKQSLETALLLEITKKITSTLNSAEVLESIVDSLSQLVTYDAAAIFLVDDKKNTLQHMVTRGYDPEFLDRVPIKIDQGISGHVIRTKKALITPDVSKSRYYFPVKEDIKSQITIPLFSGENVIGVLVLESKEWNHFKQSDLKRLTTFASLASIAIDNAKLYEDSLRKKRLESDLLVASKIQKALLPRRPPCIPGIQIEALNIPSQIVGGDLYDVFRSNQDKLGVAIGDVSGKGAPAAILMAVVYAGFKSLLKEIYQVSEVIARLNNLLEEATTPGYFATFFFGMIEPQKNKLYYCNAGHNPPVLLKSNKRVSYLETGGTVLGFLPNQIYTQAAVEFASGDYLILYTDGITEIKNREGEEFGEDRLEKLLLKNYGAPPREMRKTILQSIQSFAGTMDFQDDVTMLIIYKE